MLDPAEREFAYDEATSLEDLESGERVPIVPTKLRAEYRALVTAHLEALARITSERRVDYALFDTATPLDAALFRYLCQRELLARVR